MCTILVKCVDLESVVELGITTMIASGEVFYYVRLSFLHDNERTIMRLPWSYGNFKSMTKTQPH